MVKKYNTYPDINCQYRHFFPSVQTCAIHNFTHSQDIAWSICHQPDKYWEDSSIQGMLLSRFKDMTFFLEICKCSTKLPPMLSPNSYTDLIKVFRSTAKQPTQDVGSVRRWSSGNSRNYKKIIKLKLLTMPLASNLSIFLHFIQPHLRRK